MIVPERLRGQVGQPGELTDGDQVLHAGKPAPSCWGKVNTASAPSAGGSVFAVARARCQPVSGPTSVIIRTGSPASSEAARSTSALVPSIPGRVVEGLPHRPGVGRPGIGGTPLADGAAGIGLVTNSAGYLLTGGDFASGPGGNWPLRREPLPLETNRPGVFAAGDVRCGSVKRCSAAIGEGSMAVALVHRRLSELGGD